MTDRTAAGVRAVFLDRDGVLNEAPVRDGRPYSPASVADVVLLEGVVDACRALHDAGWLLVVVTNQPDIARGRASSAEVEAINAFVVADLPVTEVVVCPHDDVDGCACRKPAPGMLTETALRLGIDLSQSVMVGDRWRDIEAGLRAGVRTIHIDRGYGEPQPDHPDAVVASLPEAAALILSGGPGAGAQGVDDWESHWSEFADVSSRNPAQSYRRLAIIDAIRSLGPPTRLLDIGSGQGELLADLRAAWPGAEVAGIELSAEGVRRGEVKVPDARFLQLDLLSEQARPPDLEAWADLATCSEVLEHVEHPEVLLRAGAWFVRPGGHIVITVPGGPRTAFDRHIGHRRHYTPDALRAVIEQAGLEPIRVHGTGFPFFNLYKLLVLVRGQKVIDDGSASTEPSRLADLVLQAFGAVLRPRCNSARFGWQIVAVARRRA